MSLYLDAESTGLDTLNDEPVEIAIAGDDGATVFHSLVRPVRHTEWPDAEEVHGITPAMVANAPTLEQLTPQIQDVVRDQDVVIYNAAYDGSLLADQLSLARSLQCCMEAYAEYVGDWSEYHQNYRWIKLTEAAHDVRHEWSGNSHRALADALACRSVWRYLNVPEETARVEEIRRQEQLERRARNDLERQFFVQEMRQRQWRDYMDGFVRRWWIKPNPAIHWLRSLPHCEREEALTRLFFGKSPVALQLEDWFDTIYYRKKDIPDHLWPANRFNKAVWYQEELEPCAAYVGNKLAYRLYNQTEEQRIQKLYPLRFASEEVSDGKELVTWSTLKKRGYTNDEIAVLPPVAERQNSYNQEWYWLYLVDKAAATPQQ